MSGARTVAAGGRRFVLDANEVTRLVLALRIAAPAAARGASEQAQLRAAHGVREPGTDAIVFPPEEQAVVLRALEALRQRGELTGEGIRWHDALVASAAPPPIAYRVEREGGRESRHFVSRSGRYAPGDRLPGAQGEWLQVVRVEPSGAEPVLVCGQLHARPGALAA